MQQEEQVSLMWLSCMSLLLEKRVRMEEMEEEDAEVRRTSHEGAAETRPGQGGSVDLES